MAERKRRRQTENYFDYSLLFIVLFLLGFGLVMIYSTSCYEANMQGHESTFYLKKQVMATIIGLGAMIVVANIPYHFWERFSMLAYIGSAVLILMVLIPGLQYSANGATRWIRVGGLTLHQDARQRPEPAAGGGGEAGYDSLFGKPCMPDGKRHPDNKRFCPCFGNPPSYLFDDLADYQ